MSTRRSATSARSDVHLRTDRVGSLINRSTTPCGNRPSSGIGDAPEHRPFKERTPDPRREERKGHRPEFIDDAGLNDVGDAKGFRLRLEPLRPAPSEVVIAPWWVVLDLEPTRHAAGDAERRHRDEGDRPGRHEAYGIPVGLVLATIPAERSVQRAPFGLGTPEVDEIGGHAMPVSFASGRHAGHQCRDAFRARRGRWGRIPADDTGRGNRFRWTCVTLRPMLFGSGRAASRSGPAHTGAAASHIALEAGLRPCTMAHLPPEHPGCAPNPRRSP